MLDVKSFFKVRVRAFHSRSRLIAEFSRLPLKFGEIQRDCEVTNTEQ